MNIVSRAEWGARPPRARTLVDWPVGVDLWIHHTAGDGTFASVEEEMVEMRGIQNLHMAPPRNWNDIGYAYVAFPSGRLYEGRGFEVFGAHSPGRNHQPSISMAGNYSAVNPTAILRDTVFALDDFLDTGDLRGHRENSPTTCPGDRGMSFVVNAVPPDELATRPRYFFEELPFSEGGTGPVIVGQAIGYASKAVMTGKLAAFKAAHPLTPTSTFFGLFAQNRPIVPDTDETDARRYFIYTWAPNTHGLLYRFGPWRSENDRDAALLKRQRNTGRTMRPFNGRQRSRYPWQT